ncbi:hypothetical protein IW138_001463 [Coemansia sp. RSA 986]|nr:hypothetical protein IW138_001463 [Coemansia sp. RSA 986]
MSISEGFVGMAPRIKYTHFISSKADILAGCIGGFVGYFLHEKKDSQHQEKPLVELVRRRVALEEHEEPQEHK